MVRLDTLARYGILDTAPEPSFDDLVQIARRVCKVPVALISLVAQDRQWFKARVGFDPHQTPISQSICVHALASPDLLIIPDLTQDPRTAANTLVTDHPHLRFYAGAPLITPDGVAIGSLCVIDHVPRPAGLNEAQRATLAALARQTILILQLREAMQGRERALAKQVRVTEVALERASTSEAARERLSSAEALVREAQEAARVGAFEIDIEADTFHVSAEFCRIVGVPRQDVYPATELEALIQPPDRTRIASSRRSRADASASLDVEYRIRRPSDGALRWISRRGAFQFDAQGNPRRMLGVVQDVTERKLADQRTNALVTLADALRGATSIRHVAQVSARLLGETLGVLHAGFATLDEGKSLYGIETDWTASGVRSLVGTWPREQFAATLERLSDGLPLVVANIPAASWLAADAGTYEALGIRATITVPLLQNGMLVGILFVHSAIPRTWNASEIDFTVAVADRAHAVISKLKAEAHQRVLNEELSHRLKNTLALVQAIIVQTLRGQVERGTIRSLEDRITALSKAHNILLQENWSAAPISAVLANVLEAQGRHADFEVEGPDLMLNAKATLSLALLIHEMTTNSIKHGALSAKTGRVEMDWSVQEFGSAPTFALRWRERGGPPAIAPREKGFGSRLIAMGLAGSGGANLTYAPAGLEAEFTAPLHAIATL